MGQIQFYNGQYPRGGVETYIVFSPRFLSRVVPSKFLLLVTVVHLVSAVFVYSQLSACVLFLRVDAHCVLAQGRLVKRHHIVITVSSVIDCCKTVCVLLLMST